MRVRAQMRNLDWQCLKGGYTPSCARMTIHLSVSGLEIIFPALVSFVHIRSVGTMLHAPASDRGLCYSCLRVCQCTTSIVGYLSMVKRLLMWYMGVPQGTHNQLLILPCHGKL